MNIQVICEIEWSYGYAVVHTVLMINDWRLAAIVCVCVFIKRNPYLIKFTLTCSSADVERIAAWEQQELINAHVRKRSTFIAMARA